MAREEKEEKQNEQIKEMGTVNLEENRNRHKIKLLTIIGEIERHGRLAQRCNHLCD